MRGVGAAPRSVNEAGVAPLGVVALMPAHPAPQGLAGADRFARIIVIGTETGEEISIAVLENRGHQVRNGIGASKRFEMVRLEVLDRTLAGEAPWAALTPPSRRGDPVTVRGVAHKWHTVKNRLSAASVTA
jgi:sRNA-binding carbon storage regulator CsrA